MIVIQARNVNTAARGFCAVLKEHGVRRDSRNGIVTYLPVPVTTMYLKPTERVMWNPERDANPFFHLMESLWMLAGRRDVKFVEQFAATIKNFSDDGLTFNGAYGWRWRSHFGRDQLAMIIKALKADPNCRRQVLQMWDGREDLGNKSKDVPCNTSAMFSVSPSGTLDMTVTNRSNDAVWGAYGANSVHFSVLQEYVASHLGREVGTYWQVSNNLHCYDFNAHLFETVAMENAMTLEPYSTEIQNLSRAPYPLFTQNELPEYWDQDLAMFMDTPACVGYRHRFFPRVALPMLMAYRAFKDRGDPERFQTAYACLSQMARCDWQLACELWLKRKEASAQRRAESDAQIKEEVS